MTVCAAGGMGHAMVIERDDDDTRAQTRPTLSMDARRRHSRRHDRPARRSRSTRSARRCVGEFEGMFLRIDEDPLIKGVVLISGKPDNFIAGADIDQFLALKSPAEAERISRLGQDLLQPPGDAARAGRRGDSRRLSRRRTRDGARLSLSHRHRPSEDDARASRGAARAHSRAWAARSGCRGSSGCRPRST